MISFVSSHRNNLKLVFFASHLMAVWRVIVSGNGYDIAALYGAIYGYRFSLITFSDPLADTGTKKEPEFDLLKSQC